MGSKRVTDYLRETLSNMSSMLFGSDDVSEEIEINEIDTLTTQDWSKDNECNETVVLRRADYDNICSELSLARAQANSYRIKEREYKKELEEMNNTLSYFLTKEDENKTVILEDMKHRRNEGSICLQNDIDRLRAAELRLKSHIKALKRDLFEAENKSEAFKETALQDIEKLKEEAQALKEDLEKEKKNNQRLVTSMARLEDTIGKRSEECVELVEYCKLLLNRTTKENVVD
ncbi:hypothetical protein NGRA_1531 [Nosema granulosis]|uniref:Uncharacterized protein n=1 Tax=Nosema granulosis TaxID=83296 RepID=A0A9P6H1L3_9MICR|nr:hypothetical protein NGRA_1531 [Nosema granulosis]